MLDFRRRRATLRVVLVVAVIVALVLLAVAVTWGHAPPASSPRTAAERRDLPDTRAA
ncbi:MAG TPA: hypothetical protein VH989_01210 [Actinomycetota bacterium]|jgi:hypothetical protein